MAVWTLETATDVTPFYFPLTEEKTYFHELVKNYFEESKAVSEIWHSFLLLRGEPMKYSDFFEIDGSDVIAISQKAKDSLHNLLVKGIEVLPIETDAGRYYAINVLNFVDCLNRDESIYVPTKDGIIASYSLLEFNEEKLAGNAIFKIPELPYRIFVSDDIQELYEDFNLQGLVFDVESNLIWFPE